MLQEKQNTGGLDLFRLIAALLVVAIHTAPLEDISPSLNYFLVNVLARLAVPFFLCVTGYFVLSSPDEDKLLQCLKKTALLYVISMLLYLPLGIYAGHYEGLSSVDRIRLLLFDGTFYHLWYFPALLLGLPLSRALQKLPPWVSLAGAFLLYFLGLLGDSYWGLTIRLPALADVYDRFFAISSYTRCGLFFLPLFLLMGAVIRQEKKSPSPLFDGMGFLVSFLLLTGEAFFLRYLGWQRHTSMYLALPLCLYFLLRFLLALPIRQRPMLRRLFLWVYILHPGVIVALRLFAKITHTTSLLVENSPVQFLTVSILSILLSYCTVMLLNRKKQKTYPRGRAWCELDLAALRHNIEIFRSRLPATCRLMPAVKANGYGHGMIPLSKALSSMGVDAFCVASISEGVELRQNGIKGEILILGYTNPRDFPLLVRYHLMQTVVDLAYALQLNEYGKPLQVHIALDTGMRRLGVDARDHDAIARIMDMKNLSVVGIFTHLCTDDTDKASDCAFTDEQAKRFADAVDALKKRGYSIPRLHMQASYGVLNYPHLAGDYARVGIALYGIKSNRGDLDRSGADLTPVLKFAARVACIKELAPGEGLGYGLDHVAEHPSRVAIVTAGYADGVPRALSGGMGRVLIGGEYAPIIGRICMDQLTVDVTHLSHVSAGDEVTLLGRDGDNEISVYEWAETCGTLTNEILSRLGTRPERVIWVHDAKRS